MNNIREKWISKFEIEHPKSEIRNVRTNGSIQVRKIIN